VLFRACDLLLHVQQRHNKHDKKPTKHDLRRMLFECGDATCMKPLMISLIVIFFSTTVVGNITETLLPYAQYELNEAVEAVQDKINDEEELIDDNAQDSKSIRRRSCLVGCLSCLLCRCCNKSQHSIHPKNGNIDNNNNHKLNVLPQEDNLFNKKRKEIELSKEYEKGGRREK
jgi:hypothetical protein